MKPKSVSRPKRWSEEVEEAYRFQVAGYRDENEYKEIKNSGATRWEHNGYVKKLQRKDGCFIYFDKTRECLDKDLIKTKIYCYWVNVQMWCDSSPIWNNYEAFHVYIEIQLSSSVATITNTSMNHWMDITTNPLLQNMYLNRPVTDIEENTDYFIKSNKTYSVVNML